MQIRHEDARILREGLARVFKIVPKSTQAEIATVLQKYAKGVGEYCEHPDVVQLPREALTACLDCGLRMPLK